MSGLPAPADHHARHHANTQPVIAEIEALLSRLARRLEPEDGERRQWLAQHFRNPVILALVPELTMTMFRVLDAIGRLEPVNGITISRQFQIPKGSVSKVTRRLVAKGLIGKEALPNNKKEVLFRLTPLGRELFEAHRAFDQQMESRLVQFLQRYDPDELRFIVRLLQDVLAAPWPAPRPDTFDTMREP